MAAKAALFYWKPARFRPSQAQFGAFAPSAPGSRRRKWRRGVLLVASLVPRYRPVLSSSSFPVAPVVQSPRTLTHTYAERAPGFCGGFVPYLMRQVSRHASLVLALTTLCNAPQPALAADAVTT